VELLIAATILAVIEVGLTKLMFRALHRLQRLREQSGSTERITLASSPTMIIWFYYHCAMMVMFGVSSRFDDRTKYIAVYVGTPLLYLAIFALTGRRGLGWHSF
jgi:hypothetical protein